ncbi:SusC/RagA family TonB-linked outer membrane protein [Pedobacter cryoconitis]|uniref:TonB-linked SusC/RagA family outer membrane protein n=1 Tax=Pedobacter cryoconitis TaxID=188932 RepID=A0A327T7I7_9SPHI|nr:TonB-dependent receptor [Pedobacter cryoconitis]RAJ37168.1 TonB-linked SusC/RagA family outer membrane protein [Pedobacter cryoconitis]
MTKLYKPINPGLNRVFPLLAKLKQFSLNQLTIVITTLALTLCSAIAFAQTPVTGKVTDEQGLPMPGVSVKVKKTTNGTITDGNGQFALKTTTDVTLEFSYIGYTQQDVAIAGKNVINVSLKPDAKQMDEVVVVGYTTKSKSQIVSSVSTVSAKQLLDVTSNSTGNLLQGKAAGVAVSSSSGQPGTPPSIRIRGSGSITSGNEPLTVVDGVIGGTANPRDIESITVLKDAGATGLYGSRAANGVIVITTKQGKSGKTVVNYSGSFGINNATQGNFKLMDGQQLLDYSSYLYNNDYTGKRASYIKQLQATTPNPTPQQIDDFLTQKGLPLTSEAYLAQSLPTTPENTNWRDQAFRQAYTNSQNINISGGDEKTRFYIGADYYDEKGTLINTGYNNVNFRVNLDHKINDRFRITTRINAGFGKRTDDQSGALYQAYTNVPWDNPYNADGTPRRIDQESQWYGRDKSNFVFLKDYNLDNERSQNLAGDLKLEYKINNWLNFATSNRYTTENTKRETAIDIATPGGLANKGELRNLITYTNSILTSNLFNAAHSFGKHNLSGIAGFEYQQNYTEGLDAKGYGIVSGITAPDAAATAADFAGLKGKNRFISELFMADYNYDNRYFATASLRNDGSSKFGANHPYGLFYSFAGGWLISNESFFKSKTITNLKLRASYGVTGNTPNSNYAAPAYYSLKSQYAGIPGATPSSIGNPDLTWETPTTINLGANIGLWNRIELNVDVYQRTNKDLIIDVRQAAATGYSFFTQNIGAVKNQGIDIELNTKNFTGAFKWNTNFNIGFNKNRVTKLYEGQPLDKFDNQRIAIGHDMNSWYTYEWAGVDPQNGDPLWFTTKKDASGNSYTTTTNQYKDADKRFVGTSSPKFTGGMGNEFTYKNFSLNTFFNFVYGSKIYNGNRDVFDADGAYPQYNSIVLPDGWNRWEKPGDIATHPKAVLNGNKLSNKPSSRFLEDGSYLRLRNVTVGYNFSDAITKRLKLSNLRIYVSADNLLTFTKFSGMDPEVANLDPASYDNPNPNTVGTSGKKYPISKKILFGVNIGF